MTLITFQDGKPVMRDGKVGTGQGCCCGGCPRCIRNGEIDCTYKTQESCEECVRTYECYEQVQTECEGNCPDGLDAAGTNVTLSFSSPGCAFPAGGGADVVIGCGQILSATVTDGGAGYAIVGRVAPTITATVAGGSGATLSVTLAQEQDSCGVDYWRVDAVSVTNGGSDYADGSFVTFNFDAGDLYEYGASASISVDESGAITAVTVIGGGYYYREDDSQPAYTFPVTVTVNKGLGEPGSGAALTAVVDDDPDSATFGQITGVTVTNGGSGYVSLCAGTRPVDDCDECPPLSSPESAECLVVTEEGGCGEWTPGYPCEPCHECDTAADCPNFQLPCEDTFPGSPYNCCEVNGERTCKPWACYPGATITLQFRKKVGCVASGNDPDNVLGFVNEGEEFEVAISGGSMSDCSDTSDWSSAPCSTQWTLSTGCVVSDLTCDTSTGPNPAATALCQSCYEFLGWSSCRNDCNGNCA